ncbi:hypothetical protein SG34_003985 [Thalassomonas viridans]|uniref:Uncharacterized protein n=1 Tax=Thalassomonas viridans TaxID=137584 RepID=A0AAE9Z4W3_9GAMM|nr:hypothetical protein [Thalassomonas viridans]WDE06099.1 hypothetical protein SG34_003985 [Thalassomonas viridans]
MWPKSLVAFFFGIILSISLMLNLNHLLPVPVDVRLLIGLVTGFCLWVAVMVYCYSRNTARAAVWGCCKTLLASGAVNVYFFVAG